MLHTRGKHNCRCCGGQVLLCGWAWDWSAAESNAVIYSWVVWRSHSQAFRQTFMISGSLDQVFYQLKNRTVTCSYKQNWLFESKQLSSAIPRALQWCLKYSSGGGNLTFAISWRRLCNLVWHIEADICFWEGQRRWIESEREAGSKWT